MKFPTIITAAAALALASAAVTSRAQAINLPAATVSSVHAATSSVTASTISTVQDAKIDISVNEDKGGAWYTNSVWIAIGIIALVLVIALIAMASRGRDTTVVK